MSISICICLFVYSFFTYVFTHLHICVQVVGVFVRALSAECSSAPHGFPSAVTGGAAEASRRAEGVGVDEPPPPPSPLPRRLVLFFVSLTLLGNTSELLILFESQTFPQLRSTTSLERLITARARRASTRPPRARGRRRPTPRQEARTFPRLCIASQRPHYCSENCLFVYISWPCM